MDDKLFQTNYPETEDEGYKQVMADYQDIIPYTCVILDACWKDFMRSIYMSTVGSTDRESLVDNLKKLWMSPQNTNHVLPCLSVRTALDLYLRIKQYPPGSEVIMSALNIPDMAHIIHHHKLRIVSLDVSMDTLEPKIELLDSLVTERTVALLVAHIYNRRIQMDPFVAKAKEHNIALIEDCAEAFTGLTWLGHPECDLSLFSFGAIKSHTAFGGGIAKVKDDTVYDKMCTLHQSYPHQPHSTYLKKVVKYSFVYLLLNCPRIVKPGMGLTHFLGINHKKHVVSMLRGFPAGEGELVLKLRYQPSDALLHTLNYRLSHLDKSSIELTKVKGDYVSERLTDKVTQVGMKASVRSYWLFPVVVENPDEVLNTLNLLGVDAYRGATQLNIVEPDNGDNHLRHLEAFVTRYPHEAKYLMDHVVYLPVNKLVPFQTLDKICQALEIAVATSSSSGKISGSKVKLTSKL